MVERPDLEEHYPRTAAVARTHLDEWLSGTLPLVPTEALAQFVERAPVALLHDSFWRRVPFGTGGVRGTVGFGPNRINRTLIGLAVQGHCDFLLARHGSFETPPVVVIANDVREFHDVAGVYGFIDDNPLFELTSRSLARLAAEVYVANGFAVAMSDPDDELGLLSTPELSFLIRRLGAVGGVNLSASHNPPDDNGIKIYDDQGGQFTPPLDQDLVDAASAATTVQQGVFADARAKGLVTGIPDELIDAYRSEYVDRLRGQHLAAPPGSRVAFTPLGGCGERSVVPVLEGLGYEVFVAEGQGRDGTFSQIPLLAPNPEVAESTGPARTAAEHAGIGIVLAADPDADRLGVDVMTSTGWAHLTGNQISSVLAYFLMADPGRSATAGRGLPDPRHHHVRAPHRGDRRRRTDRRRPAGRVQVHRSRGARPRDVGHTERSAHGLRVRGEPRVPRDARSCATRTPRRRRSTSPPSTRSSRPTATRWSTTWPASTSTSASSATAAGRSCSRAATASRRSPGRWCRCGRTRRRCSAA